MQILNAYNFVQAASYRAKHGFWSSILVFLLILALFIPTTLAMNDKKDPSCTSARHEKSSVVFENYGIGDDSIYAFADNAKENKVF
jgi:hypothetical protein